VHDVLEPHLATRYSRLDKSLGMKELDEVFDRWSAPPAADGNVEML